MSRSVRYVGIAVLALGLIGAAMGIAFIVEGQAKANFIKSRPVRKATDVITL